MVTERVGLSTALIPKGVGGLRLLPNVKNPKIAKVGYKAMPERAHLLKILSDVNEVRMYGVR